MKWSRNNYQKFLPDFYLVGENGTIFCTNSFNGDDGQEQYEYLFYINFVGWVLEVETPLREMLELASEAYDVPREELDRVWQS